MISGRTTVLLTESTVTANIVCRLTGLETFATRGHVYDFALNSNMVTLKPKSVAIVERLRLFNRSDLNLLIATDNDQQGELIASHLKALTPKATHQRINLTALSEQAILNALETPNGFSEKLANQAAYLRVLNLRLKEMAKGGSYLTTTGITLAKSFLERGSARHWINHTVDINGKELYTKLPANMGKIQPINIYKTMPCNTRSIVTAAVFSNIQNIHQQLQDAYEKQELSYIRTDSHALPTTNAAYSHHVGSAELEDAHYAIHNLTPYESDVTRLVYKINESACSDKIHVVSLESQFGQTIAMDEPLPEHVLSPSQDIMLHLATDPDSYASTITSHSSKYQQFLFNGERVNHGLLERTVKEAQRLLPEIVSVGVKKTIDKLAIETPNVTDSMSEAIDAEISTLKKPVETGLDFINPF